MQREYCEGLAARAGPPAAALAVNTAGIQRTRSRPAQLPTDTACVLLMHIIDPTLIAHLPTPRRVKVPSPQQRRVHGLFLSSKRQFCKPFFSDPLLGAG